ncbi:MAG: potassium channel protein [Leptolyngbyaceae bacterium]|nr:potassium channel protein [Leptolyngbyaceae bacterium]
MYSTTEQKYRRLQKELLIGLLIVIAITIIGTIGYRFIEGWSWVDSAYMTVITLATVGFTEIEPMGAPGRIFTITLILMGILSLGYIANRFTEAFLQGYFQKGLRIRQQRRLIDNFREHYIICGYGRMGQQIATEFAAEGIDFVIIDQRVELIDMVQNDGFIGILGDATHDDILIRAGIARALCIIAALPSDAENLYIMLSARALQPGIRAIARANSEEAVQKLERGGADAVVSPYITGGKRMAAAALRPQVMDFVDGIVTGAGRSFYMEEYLVNSETCAFVGQTLREASLRARSGALVVAIRRADGDLLAGPTADTQFKEGDVLICMGTSEQLMMLNQILDPLRGRLLRPPRQSPQRETY